MPCYPDLPSTPSPVHRELGHQGDIVGPGRWRLVGQEGDMHPMHSELLLPELKAGLFLIQLCHGLLQLSRVQRKNEQGWSRTACRSAKDHLSTEGQDLPKARWYDPSHLLGFGRELTGAAKELSPQQFSIISKEGQVQVSEEFCMLVLHAKLLW